MKRKYKICGIILLLFLTTNIYGVGESSLSFLNITPDARSSALGGSIYGFGGGISSVYYNPAVGTMIDSMEIALSSLFYIADTKYFHIGIASPLNLIKSRKGSINGALSYLSHGEIPLYENNQLTGTVSPFDFYFHIGYSLNITEGISGGINIKFIHESLTEEYSGSAVGLDAGIYYESFLTGLIKKEYLKPLNLGISIRNIGIGPKFAEESETLPFSANIGFSYRYRFPRAVYKLKDINVLLGTSITSGEAFGLSIGGEGWWYNVINNIDLSFRLGLKLPSQVEGFLSLIKVGFGVRIYQGSIDYSLINYSDLGLTHSITLSYHFGPIKKPVERVQKQPLEYLKKKPEKKVEEEEIELEEEVSPAKEKVKKKKPQKEEEFEFEEEEFEESGEEFEE